MRTVNIFLIGSTFLIGLFFQGVSMYFGLIGGTVGVMMAGGIPLICFYKLIPLNDVDKILMAFVAIMGVICFLGAMQSIFNTAWLYDIDILLSDCFDLLGRGLALQHALLDVKGEEGGEDVVANYGEGQVGRIFEF